MAAGSLSGRRVAIYARFSSEKQSETSIDDQVRRCREFVQREGGSVDASYVFTDYATSGASLARTGFEAMMRLTNGAKPDVEVIVAEDLSRVTRDLADGAMLFRRLQFQGVKLIGVADGVDTSAKHAKLTYTVKNLVADIYLDDLRDKTLRGLEGRHHASLSTGNPPYGYRSVAVGGPESEHSGRRIEIDEEKARIVRRVFSMHLDGRSLNAIARTLFLEGVPPPRANTRHRRKGWVDATIRVFLHNERYVGIWRYKQRQWVKVPGENRRVPRLRDASEVLAQNRPDLRIIDERTWRATQARLASTRARFTLNPDGTRKGRAVIGKQTHYLLSGLLFCGACGAPMIIHGSTTAPTYRCPDYSKRRTCTNALAVKEQLARTKILEALHNSLFSPEGLVYARKRIAERLGDWVREQNAEVTERRKRLERTENRIAGLIQFISDGDQSSYVRVTLADLEAQAQAEKEAIASRERNGSAPIRLPSPAELERLASDVERRIAQDPIGGREHLRQLLKDGRIVLQPQPDGVYLARTEVLSMVLLDASAGGARQVAGPEDRRSGELPGAAMSRLKCAGGGPPISIDPTQGGCLGALAQTTFRWALCSCTDLDVSAPIMTDAFDSTMAPYQPGQLGGGVGVDRDVTHWSQAVTVGGDLWDSGGGNYQSSGPASEIKSDMHLAGSWNASSAFTVDGNALVTGTFAGVTVKGMTSHPASVSPPCDCTQSQLVPVAAIVAAHRAPNNDDAAIQLDPTVFESPSAPLRLDLPCGNYYLTKIATATSLTIAAHGQTALYIDGDVTPSAPIAFVLDPTAELDVFIAGTITSSQTIVIGSPNYPALSRTYIGGTASLKFSQNVSIGGEIYAADSQLVDWSANSDIYGSVFAGDFKASQNTNIHYDRGVLRAGTTCPPPKGDGGVPTCGSCRDCGNQACINGTCGACQTSADCCAPLACVNGTCELMIKID